MSRMRLAIRAFRGTRRSSVYREHVLPDCAVVRILETAQKDGLSLLSRLREGTRELDKPEARALAAELDTLRQQQDLPDLDTELVAAAEVARWCARASGEARLRIESYPDDDTLKRPDGTGAAAAIVDGSYPLASKETVSTGTAMHGAANDGAPVPASPQRN